ncbi:hypothetical protein [Niabella drilacis]|uniref:hypothetical protein n=1 Tax=Niabella drilacis (strain DSM 25811 / CCM 8410 / CCUG 62505 / LMG 26954 / E90) TaxID=1285928 RepID=UPI00115F92C3|nr:hypothetical protein [Niabella drilacis]
MTTPVNGYFTGGSTLLKCISDETDILAPVHPGDPWKHNRNRSNAKACSAEHPAGGAENIQNTQSISAPRSICKALPRIFLP